MLKQEGATPLHPEVPEPRSRPRCINQGHLLAPSLNLLLAAGRKILALSATGGPELNSPDPAPPSSSLAPARVAVVRSRQLRPEPAVERRFVSQDARELSASCAARPESWASSSLTQVLRWAHWWNSTEESPDDVTTEQVLVELNTDFSTKGLGPQEIQAIVAAWQANAISRDTMTDLFRRGEVLPEGRTNEEEEKLIAEGAPPTAAKTQVRVVHNETPL